LKLIAKKRWFVLISGSVIALVGTVQAQTAANPLRELIDSAISFSRSTGRDEFSEPPRAGDSEGAIFHFTVPLHSFQSPEPTNYTSSAIYDYRDGQLTTYLDHWFHPLDVFEPARVIRGRSYSGSNAFGVNATIQVETILKGGISITNVIDPSRITRRISSSPRGRSFIYNQEVSGSEARILAGNLRYEIEGTIGHFSDGRSVKCRSGSGNPPTLERPKDFTYHFCTVAVQASKITLVDSVSNQTLRVWEGAEIITAGRRF